MAIAAVAKDDELRKGPPRFSTVENEIPVERFRSDDKIGAIVGYRADDARAARAGHRCCFGERVRRI